MPLFAAGLNASALLGWGVLNQGLYTFRAGCETIQGGKGHWLKDMAPEMPHFHVLS